MQNHSECFSLQYLTPPEIGIGHANLLSTRKAAIHVEREVVAHGGGRVTEDYPVGLIIISVAESATGELCEP